MSALLAKTNPAATRGSVTRRAILGAGFGGLMWVIQTRLAAFAPPRRLVLGDYRYRSRNGAPPFRPGFQVEFEVERSPAGRTLRVTQDGFPGDTEADAFYHACEPGWRDTLAGMERFFSQ